MKVFSNLLLVILVFSVIQVFSQDLAPTINNSAKFEAVNLQGYETEGQKSSSQQSIITVLPHDGFHSRHSAPQSLFRFARCYFLILASEMNASGFPSGVNITSLGYNYKYGTNLATTGFFKVYFQNTSDVINNKTTNWNQAIAPMINVHSDSLRIQTANGTFDITLNASGAFTYTGGGIYIAFEYSNPVGLLATVSNVVWCNKALPSPILRSSQSDDSLRIIATGSSNLRPETRFGCEKIDIVTVGPIYSMGMVGIWPCPDTNSVNVVVNHMQEVQDTIIITTKVKNAIGGLIKQTFIDTIINDVIGSVVIVNKYLIDSKLNIDSIIVSAVTSGEDILGNNVATYLVQTTINKWNHYIPLMPPNGGVGLSVGTGDYVARFHTPCCLSICAVDLSFFAETGWGGNPYKVIIYAADGPDGLPGTLLHSSPDRISPAAFTGVIKKSTYFLATHVVICSGYYFVGYSQTDERNLRVSYQIETPIRTGELYYTTPFGSGNWTEFAEISPYRFDIAPRTYLRLEMKVYLQGFYNGVKMISDTVKVITRSQTPPYNAVDSASAVLDSNGNGIFNFINVNSDSCYYFDVQHRNHIRTFSHSICQKLNGSPSVYDFTTSASKAFGNNMLQVDNSPVRFAIYSGDVNQDGIVDLTDRSLIDNDSYNFVTGYVNTDVNGDDVVDLADATIADNNGFNFVSKITP